jgi:peptidylprolyl isomerase
MNGLKTGFPFFLFLLFGLFISSCKDDYTERIKQQKEADDASIQEYLTYNNIQNAQRQPSGVYYIPQTPGTGAQVQRGNTIKIHYIGRYLSTQKFESTYDSGQPLTVVANTGRNNGLTEGLNEGLLLLKEGEKATIIVPSMLGYGQYTSVLVYEVSVLEVK